MLTGGSDYSPLTLRVVLFLSGPLGILAFVARLAVAARRHLLFELTGVS